jgi:DNA-binding HxlR family transcriptional regulator
VRRGARTAASEGAHPVAQSLGRRWALRIVWELRDGPLLFRELQGRCEEMSSSVLNQRLQELRAAGILRGGEGGYRLTQEGSRLLEAYAPLEAWARRWAQRAVPR